MSASQQWAGLSKPQASRKSSGRHRKLPGTPFFQVEPVVSLDRLEHPKPKVTRRRSRKASSKENQPASTSRKNSISVGAEFSTLSTSDGEKLSTDPRTEVTGSATFGESSMTYVSDDQNTQQFLANADLNQQVDDPVIGQTITYASDEDAVGNDGIDGADGDDFCSGLSLSYSSTLNCNSGTMRAVTADNTADSYVEFDSSLCQFRNGPVPAPFVDVPIPEKHPAAPSPVANTDLMQPLLTAADSDKESDHADPVSAPQSGFWNCLFCCFPQRSMSRFSRFLI